MILWSIENFRPRGELNSKVPNDPTLGQLGVPQALLEPEAYRFSGTLNCPSNWYRPPVSVASGTVLSPSRTVASRPSWERIVAEDSVPSVHARSTSKPPRARSPLHRSRGPGLGQGGKQVVLAVGGVTLKQHLGYAGREGEVAVHAAEDQNVVLCLGAEVVNALPPLKVVQLLGNACLSPTTLAPKDPF